MEEFERFERALRLVERYETYLFKRAMGVALIICGIVFPLTAFIVLKAKTISALLSMSSEAFLAFVPSAILLIGIVTIVYSITSAHVVTSRMRRDSFWKDFPHIVVMFMVWFFSFFLTSFVPEPLEAVSSLWAGGFASLVSYTALKYILIKRDTSHGNFPELLVIGIICIISSLPLLLLGDAQLVLTITLLVFNVSFVAGGIYSLISASKFLNESDK